MKEGRAKKKKRGKCCRIPAMPWFEREKEEGKNTQFCRESKQTTLKPSYSRQGHLSLVTMYIHTFRTVISKQNEKVDQNKKKGGGGGS